MANRRAPRTLLELVVARVGMLRGPRVLGFMIAWDTARLALGDEWPEGKSAQVIAYGEWWRQSERTTWRELARFHECFPDEATPERLMSAARAEWDSRRGVRGLGAVPIDAVAA